MTEEDGLTYCRDQMVKWSASGLPFIAPVNTGYDASKVANDRAVYGLTPEWRQRQRDLAVEFTTAGLSFDTCNGYTEGQSILPTVEDGDAVTTWARETVRAVRRKLYGAADLQACCRPAPCRCPARCAPANAARTRVHRRCGRTG